MIIVPNQILDIAWKFGVTAASSESDRLGNTFIHLRILIDEGNGESSNIFVEMTLGHFYKFLHDLEEAQSSLELLL